MKKILLAVCLILILFLIGSLSGFHFKGINTLPDNVKMVRSSDIGDYASAVLFEDYSHKTFGVAKIEKSLAFCIGMMVVLLVIC